MEVTAYIPGKKESSPEDAAAEVIVIDSDGEVKSTNPEECDWTMQWNAFDFSDPSSPERAPTTSDCPGQLAFR